jgi:Ca-activated chloride channel family protein
MRPEDRGDASRRALHDADRERDWRLLVGGVLVLGFVLVFASAARAGDTPGAGALVLRTAAGEVTAPWIDTDVDIRVSGMVARVRVRQRFINDRPEFVEGVYLFPLPECAAVNAMRMQVGDRIVEGEIREREEARKAYVEARADGRRASLVEQSRANLFRTSIANLAPYDTIEVELEYLEVLRYDAGRFSVRLPLTSTPRYEPASMSVSASGAPDTMAAAVPAASPGGFTAAALYGEGDGGTEAIVPAILHIDDDARAMASVHVDLDAGFALAELSSPYHAVHIERAGKRHLVDLAAGKVPMDRDFELTWRPDTGTTPGAAVFSETLDGENYALVMLVPNARSEQALPPREMIFVIDTSGSMEGMALAQAKAAVALAIAGLGPRDRFNVIQFDSVTQSLYDSPVANAATTRAQALDYVESLTADGGTEMELALAAAFSGAAPRGYLRQVVFVTDGGIANEDALLAQIGAQLGDARLFTVAIGAAPNAFFMHKAAELGRGTFTFIGTEQEVGTRMRELLAKLAAPALTDIEITWPSAVEAWPAHVPDLYAGEPVIVRARLPALAGTVAIRGNIGGRAWSASLPLDANRRDEGVATLWARGKIEALMDAQRHGADVKREIVEVALRHRIVSAYTSFVAVDRTPVRPAQAALHARNVPSLMPATAAGEALIGFAQTATTASLHAVACLLLLALGLLCRRVAMSRPRVVGGSRR